MKAGRFLTRLPFSFYIPNSSYTTEVVYVRPRQGSGCKGGVLTTDGWLTKMAVENNRGLEGEYEIHYEHNLII